MASENSETSRHAIIVEGELHSRRKQLSLALAEVFSAEEPTNYAARLVETLRHALGSKDYERRKSRDRCHRGPKYQNFFVDL